MRDPVLEGYTSSPDGMGGRNWYMYSCSVTVRCAASRSRKMFSGTRNVKGTESSAV